MSEEQSILHFNLKKETAYFEIVITDNGIGFNSDFAEQVFIIFNVCTTVAITKAPELDWPCAAELY